MGMKKRDAVSYYKVSDGKIRRKVDKNDPNAEERIVQIQGVEKIMYEEVFTSFEGYLRNIQVQEHEEYGTSYNLVFEEVVDGKTVKTSINVSENSRYFQSLVLHLPNIDLSRPVELKPYKFKPKDRDSESIGISFSQGGEKVPNYYKDFDGETSIAKNGLEDFDFAGAKGNKSKMKKLKIDFTDWLREQLAEQIKRVLKHAEDNDIEVPSVDPPADQHVEADESQEEEKPTGREKGATKGRSGGRGGKNDKSKSKDVPY